jgi:phage gp36-like protein
MTQHFEEIASSLLPIWDMTIPDIPPRSRLYNLAPRGLNRPFVESLTSYVCRLAYEHHVQVGTLIQYSIAPILGKHYIASDQSRSISSFLRYASPINGNSIMASDWIKALESLTLRADLALLTLLVGAKAFSQHDLLQPVRQWCPICYEVWRGQDAIIYEPLLWSINGITVCPEHRRLLERYCPYCSSSLPWLSWRFRPGCCSSCGRWLGSAEGNNQLEEKDIYIAEMVGSFLAHVPQLSIPLAPAYFIQSLRDLISTTADGNIAAFSRCLGLPKTTIWELVQGHFPPSLPFLLRLCYQFRLSLLQLLVSVEKTESYDFTSSQGQARKRNFRRTFDREKVQQALEDILADQQSASLSMREIARRLGYPVRTIETHLPVHCREISRRYAENRKQQGQFRKIQLQQRIHRAARIVISQGLNPTYQRVGSRLGEPGCFREYEARSALLEIRCQPDKEIPFVDMVECRGDTSYTSNLAK